MIRASRSISGIRPSLREAGFSLFELAIIIGIFGVALTAIIGVYNQYAKQVAYTDTMARRVNAEAALGRFYALHNRLPCPSDSGLPENDPMAGVEQCANRDRILASASFDPSRYATVMVNNQVGCNASGGICRVVGARAAPRTVTTPPIDIRLAPDMLNDTVLRGGLPYVTLGLAPGEAIDGYGGRLTYAVTEFFAGNALKQLDNNALAELRPAGGNIDIRDFGGAISLVTWMDGLTNANNAASLPSPQPLTEYSGSVATATDDLGATIKYVEHTSGVRLIRSWEQGADAGGFMPTSNNKARPLIVTDPSPINAFSMILISHGPDGRGAFTSSGTVKRDCGNGFAGLDSVNCAPLSTFVAATNKATNTKSAIYFDDSFVSSSFKDQNDRWQMASAEAAIKTKNVKVAIGKTTVRSGASVDVAGAVRAENYTEAGTPKSGALLSGMVKNVNATADVAGTSLVRGFQPVTFGSAAGVSCGQGITKGLKSGTADPSLGVIDCETRVNLDGTVNVGDCRTAFGDEFMFLVGLTPNGNKVCRSLSDIRNNASCTDLHNSDRNYSYQVGQCYGTGTLLCGGPPGTTGPSIPPASSCPDNACYDAFNAAPDQNIYTAPACSVYNYATGRFDTIKRCRNSANTSIVRLSSGASLMTCPPRYSGGHIIPGGEKGATMPVDESFMQGGKLGGTKTVDEGGSTVPEIIPADAWEALESAFKVNEVK